MKLTLYLKKPCLTAGLLLYLVLFSWSWIPAFAGMTPDYDTRGQALEKKSTSELEVESSVNVYPEDLCPGLQRLIKFIKLTDKAPKDCSKKIKIYRIEGFRIKSREVVCYIDTVNASILNKRLTPEVAFEAVTRAAAEWTSSAANLPVLTCYESTTPVKVAFGFDGRNTISWQNLSLFTKDTIGVINLIVDTKKKRLVEFDVALNESMSWAELEGSLEYSGSYDIQNVMTHAFGYVYGLGEVDTPNTCGLVMYPYVMSGETGKRMLGAGDIAGARKIYKFQKSWIPD